MLFSVNEPFPSRQGNILRFNSEGDPSVIDGCTGEQGGNRSFAACASQLFHNYESGHP
jgi:hypothetical protein